MPHVVCALDEAESEETVATAIAFCLDHSAELRLVGIAKDKLMDSTRGTGGERVRRYKTVTLRSIAPRKRPVGQASPPRPRSASATG